MCGTCVPNLYFGFQFSFCLFDFCLHKSKLKYLAYGKYRYVGKIDIFGGNIASINKCINIHI